MSEKARRFIDAPTHTWPMATTQRIDELLSFFLCNRVSAR